MNNLAQVVLNRPKDQKPYSQNNVVGFHVFGSGGTITSRIIPLFFFHPVNQLGRIILTTSSIDFSRADFELWLFRQQPTDQPDNTPFELDGNDLMHVLGVVKFDVFNGNLSRVFQSRYAVGIVPELQNIYGVLVVRATLGPSVPGEQFTLSVLV